jgi:HEAT repeats
VSAGLRVPQVPQVPRVPRVPWVARVARVLFAVALAATTANAQTLDAKIRAAATPNAVTWVGYRMPKVPGNHTMCGGDHERTAKIVLEGPREIEVLARIENGALTRLRTVTADCEIDASGATLVWLAGVTAAESTAWLSSLVSGAAATANRTNAITDSALAALAMQAGDGSGEALVGFARSHPVTRVRGQALFWLAQRAGAVALPAIANAVDNDPEIEVKRRAVFALSQLPKDEGVPKLIEVARGHRSPEVRKQAFFWLGQSKDPRAVAFFEEVLLKR